MESDYSWRWTELRRLQRRFRRAVFAAVAVLVLVFLSKFEPRSIARITALLLLAMWIFFVVKILKVYSEYTYWLCPRCGEPFHYYVGWLGRLNNPFASRCVHCGLPKWREGEAKE
jgi:hypothetical protein